MADVVDGTGTGTADSMLLDIGKQGNKFEDETIPMITE